MYERHLIFKSVRVVTFYDMKILFATESGGVFLELFNIFNGVT